MIKVDKVPSIERYLSPISESWSFCKLYIVELQPLPLKAVTTSKYIRETLKEETIGKIEEIRVNAATDGKELAIRLSWDDTSKDDILESYRDFVDACGVMFPIKSEASVMTMGSENAPVNVWYWRADGKFYDVISRGLGTTQRRDPKISGLRCFWQYIGTSWIVVFARKLKGDGSEFADLETKKTGIAFAVWEGSNRERGPLKAYSGEFMTFFLR